MAVCAARRMSADLGSAVQVMILARAISLSLLMGTSALSTSVTRDFKYCSVANLTLLFGVWVVHDKFKHD